MSVVTVVLFFLLQIFKYNTLEAVYLITSMFVLLSGMAFESSVLVPGSGSYNFLTALVRGASSCGVCPACLLTNMFPNQLEVACVGVGDRWYW